jgi:hypothetical protein
METTEGIAGGAKEAPKKGSPPCCIITLGKLFFFELQISQLMTDSNPTGIDLCMVTGGLQPRSSEFWGNPDTLWAALVAVRAVGLLL